MYVYVYIYIYIYMVPEDSRKPTRHKRDASFDS